MKAAADIQADFDRIALAEQPQATETWNHNDHYHDFLLRHAPAHGANALEVGCGTGTFARLLAQRSDRVLALDLAPEMLRIARERSANYPNIEYAQADIMTTPLPDAGFDCIASIATLHHLELREVLPRLKAALKPGGVLLVLDLARDGSLGDLFQSLVSIPYHRILQRRKGSHAPQSAEATAAWEAHGRDDVYPTVAEVRRACVDLLPGAQVTHHLLWRYSLVWTKSNALPKSE